MEKNFLKKKHFQNEYYYILILLLGFFSGIPFSWNIMSSSISINYLYFLFFIIFLFNEKINLKISNFFYIALSYYLIVYVLNFFQFEIDILLLRKTFSFIVFIVPFFFFIFIVNKKTIESLKYSIICVSIFYGLLTIYWYFEFLYLTKHDPSFNHALKHYIGGSRMGFFHIVAFFLILEKIFNNKNRFFYYLFFINTAAIYNTYSRTTLVALILSSILFILISIQNKNLFKFSKKFIMLFLIILLNFPIFYKTTKFYDKKFLNLVINSVVVKLSSNLPNLFSSKKRSIENQDIVLEKKEKKHPKDIILEFSNTKSSEGYRLHIWKQMIDYHKNNNSIIYGSGYVGTWIIDDKIKFSAHSQYFDIFFRTGLIGLIICIFIYTLFIINFKKNNYYLLVSFFGVLIYGLFHETFKQSQGGFLFMFYIICFLNEKYKFKKNEKSDY